MRFHEILNEWGENLLSRAKTIPEFKKWFGNSKVVDNDGNPMPCFHYTYKKFDVSEFKPLSHNEIFK